MYSVHNMWFESSQGSQNSQNIMSDEISTLHCALTDLHLENKARVSSKIRYRRDTGASGNPSACIHLPYIIPKSYYEGSWHDH